MLRLINKIPTVVYVAWVVVVGGVTVAMWLNPMTRPAAPPYRIVYPCACLEREPDAITTGKLS